MKNTKSIMDNNEINIWIESGTNKKIDSILCIADLMKKDSEIKLLFTCTDEEKRIIYEFQNNKYMKAIMINRG